MLLLCAACARTTLSGSVSDTHGSAEAEMDFWDGLEGVRAISNKDAMHALFLTFGGKAGDFAGRIEEARQRRWLDDDALPPNETAQVGWIATAVCIETPIKGGLTMRLGGRDRWAVNELNYLEWLNDMSANQAISGLQLIALLSTVEDHRNDEDTGITRGSVR